MNFYVFSSKKILKIAIILPSDKSILNFLEMYMTIILKGI